MLAALIKFCDTDIFDYSDTGYSDYPLTVTVVKNPSLSKSVTVSKYLLTVTLLPCPEGVTVIEDVCRYTTDPKFFLKSTCQA